MNKRLIALTVLCSAAGAAAAQSSVTVYGIVDVGVSRIDDGSTKTTSMDSGILNGSRIGFRGEEDLGGGLSASFRLENGYSVDDGRMRQGGRLFGRQAWVGLNGSFGTVRLGRQDNPIHTALDSIDPFGTGLAGNIEFIFNGYDSRSDNIVSYIAPKMGGFYASVVYGLGEVPDSTSTGRLVGGMVGFKTGNFNVVLSHHNQNVADAGLDVGNEKTTMIGGVYNFGVVKAHAAYAQNKGDRLGVETTDSHDAMIGFTVPFGASTVMGSYSRKEGKLAARDKTELLALGYTYSLSKRTTLYTSYGVMRNNDTGTLGVDGGTVVAGDDPKIFNVGLQHRF